MYPSSMVNSKFLFTIVHTTRVHQRMRKLFLMCQTTGAAEARFLADPLGFWQTHRRCSFAHAFPFSVLRSSLLVWDWQLVFILVWRP